MANPAKDRASFGLPNALTLQPNDAALVDMYVSAVALRGLRTVPGRER